MLEPVAYTASAVGDYRKEQIAKVYELYQKRLKENNAIDFVWYSFSIKNVFYCS